MLLLLPLMLLPMVAPSAGSVKYLSYYTYGPAKISPYPPIHNAPCKSRQRMPIHATLHPSHLQLARELQAPPD
jgi:hypothetical protein